MWWWLASCFTVPRRLDDGAPLPCAAPKVSAEALAAEVAWLASSPRRSPERRREVRDHLRAALEAAGFAVEERPFTLNCASAAPRTDDRPIPACSGSGAPPPTPPPEDSPSPGSPLQSRDSVADATSSLNSIQGTNLVATGTAGGTVWVGAHYDTVEDTPGADDNATGVAAALALATALGPSFPARYVFFDAEEPRRATVGPEGRNYAFGSQAFVDALAPGEATLAVILESLGRACADCQQVPPGVPPALVKIDGTAVYWVTDDPSPAPWADWVATARAAVPGRAVHGVGIPDHGADLPQARFSDHAAFWDAGIPAVMVTDTALLRNADYHQPGDTAERIDAQFLADATRGVGAALQAAAGACSP